MNSKLSIRAQRQEDALLRYCKKFSGTYIAGINAQRAPFATTYSKEFCDGAADLYRLYVNNKIENPINFLSRRLIESKIHTCRYNDMAPANVKYLYDKFLRDRLAAGDFLVLRQITQKQCEVCGTWKTNLEAHMRDAHQS